MSREDEWMGKGASDGINYLTHMETFLILSTLLQVQHKRVFSVVQYGDDPVRRAAKRITLMGVMMSFAIFFPLMIDTLAEAQHKDSVETLFLAYNFPAYPNLTHLCQQRVYLAGQGVKHITWDAFASEDTPSALIEHYTKRLGSDEFSPEKQGGTWRFPKEKPVRVLSIIPVDAEGPHRGCHKNPSAQAKSIIILSTTY